MVSFEIRKERTWLVVSVVTDGELGIRVMCCPLCGVLIGGV
jgi:hypothetical protein